MKKSDIILSVVMHSDKSKTEEQIRSEITAVLISHSLNIDQWDKAVPSSIANALIKNMTSYSDKPSIKYLVRDIDMIMDRIA